MPHSRGNHTEIAVCDARTRRDRIGGAHTISAYALAVAFKKAYEDSQKVVEDIDE